MKRLEKLRQEKEDLERKLVKVGSLKEFESLLNELDSVSDKIYDLYLQQL